MNLFHEVNNFLNEEELSVVDNYILTPEFPWYFQQHATSDLFPFHSHVIYARDMLVMMKTMNQYLILHYRLG